MVPPHHSFAQRRYPGEARLVRTVAGRVRAMTASADLELPVECDVFDVYVDRAGCGGKER